MLIATLPTLVSNADLRLSREILTHSQVAAVRYNTGGDSPLSPKKILTELQALAKQTGKALYVDLEGRQTRVAKWTPQSRGSVTLNRSFQLELPGQIHFRRAGWCEIKNFDPTTNQVYFQPRRSRNEYYLGESQSVHVVAERFEVKGYLGGKDREYIQAAVELGIAGFMLSFAESMDDLSEFFQHYQACGGRPEPDLVLKIESEKGLGFAKEFGSRLIPQTRLMAARDDLFLAFVHQPYRVLEALRLIAELDPYAIVASRLLTGLESGDELTLHDLSDIQLMKNFGYQHFMFADELSGNFNQAMIAWEGITKCILNPA